MGLSLFFKKGCPYPISQTSSARLEAPQGPSPNNYLGHVSGTISAPQGSYSKEPEHPTRFSKGFPTAMLPPGAP